jgi:hypothetical protein
MRYKKHPLPGKTLIQKQEWIDNDKLSEAASNWFWWTGSLIHTSLHILHCPEKWTKFQCDCRESLKKNNSHGYQEAPEKSCNTTKHMPCQLHHPHSKTK